MIVAKQAEERKEQTRYVLCEDCNQGFTVPVSEWHPAGDQRCATCQARRNKLATLKLQLGPAQQFGHTNGDCELCAILNQIDDLQNGPYDWREDYRKRTGSFEPDSSY